MIENAAKYNTLNKTYLTKSKITRLKNYFKKYKLSNRLRSQCSKYTKKLLNYSKVSNCNLLLATSAHKHAPGLEMNIRQVPTAGRFSIWRLNVGRLPATLVGKRIHDTAI